MMSYSFTISRLTICRNSVVKYKYQPSKSLENALFSAFYLSRLFIVGNTTGLTVLCPFMQYFQAFVFPTLKYYKVRLSTIKYDYAVPLLYFHISAVLCDKSLQISFLSSVKIHLNSLINCLMLPSLSSR